MKLKSIKISIFTLFLFNSLLGIGQARINIVNNSERQLKVKIMHKSGGTYATLTVGAYETETEYFQETGNYYLKTKGSLRGKKAVCKKGNPFKVYNGTDGYSVLTITYSIRGGVSDEGRGISEEEFDRNN